MRLRSFSRSERRHRLARQRPFSIDCQRNEVRRRHQRLRHFSSTHLRRGRETRVSAVSRRQNGDSSFRIETRDMGYEPNRQAANRSILLRTKPLLRRWFPKGQRHAPRLFACGCEAPTPSTSAVGSLKKRKMTRLTVQLVKCGIEAHRISVRITARRRHKTDLGNRCA
jgi:hypothetical protein